jgi:L-fuconolactonase
VIVDAHHHLWRLGARRYAFLEEDGMEPIRRDFGVAQLTAAAAGHDVAATVVIQAAPELTETEHLLDIAGSVELIGGVVGWVALDGAEAAGQLERLQAHRCGEWLRGVRAMAQDQPDPSWLASPAVLRGVRAVGAAGLLCELLIRPPQADAALALVRALPEVPFVLDHAGKPPIAGGGDRSAWEASIAAFAREENVVCKVSGLITEARWDAWTAQEIAPWIETAAECFGEDRLMFGSDWPVCLLAGTYGEVVEVARRGLRGLDAGRIFAANARRAYRL